MLNLMLLVPVLTAAFLGVFGWMAKRVFSSFEDRIKFVSDQLTVNSQDMLAAVNEIRHDFKEHLARSQDLTERVVRLETRCSMYNCSAERHES